MRLLYLLALLLPGAAWGQNIIQPPQINGCGTMAVTTSSATITSGNITLCTNSPAFPSRNFPYSLKVKVQGSSASAVYVCWLGGTCATTGEYMAVGESTRSGVPFLVLTTQPPSVIGATGNATLYLEW